MTARMRSISILLVLFCVAAAPFAFGKDAALFAGALDSGMDTLLARYGVPGSVVASIENGEVAWARAYGVVNRATGLPMSADMLLEHGSNGKAVTAWAVMKLVEQGRVALDAPANNYLKRWQIPSGAYDASAVTVRRLLSHTSGLAIHGYLDYSMRRPVTPDLESVLSGAHLLESLTELVTAGRPSRGRAVIVKAPGTGFLYSGAGYATLQMIVEDVSGMSFASFVRQEITDPLGVMGMRWSWTPGLQQRAARPPRRPAGTGWDTGSA